jgi:flagellar hook-associated protein 2
MPGTQSIQGLASNLDIDSIVNAIIEAEREPVTYLEQEQELKTQQVAAYQAISAKFLALKSSITAMTREATFNQAALNVSDESVLTATSNGTVVPGSYNLRVLSLARNNQIASQGFDDATSTVFGTGTIKLSLGDASMTTITIDEGDNSLVGIKNAINSANVGITASIINDGTSSNPYRLVLSGNNTGAKNKISYEVSLSGGETIDLSGSSFDSPEKLSFSANSTSKVSLGSTAVYSGTENKTYTFTVGGSGTQTIGSNNITINWTDGTNSGSILVTQADTEYELTGTGADGLKLSFSAGDLIAGNTFQVNTFAPILQEASDAKIAIGADSSGTGSAIVINSAKNTFTDALPGLNITVKKVSESGTSVSISSAIDAEAIEKKISDFIDKYNDAMSFIDDQFTYDTENKDAGVLFSDYSLQVMQSSLRSAATSIVAGLKTKFTSLAAIGIRSGTDGQLSISSSSRLREAITDNFQDFVDLFTDSGNSSSTFIEFVSAGSDTIAGKDYNVEITHAATKGYYQGSNIADPSLSPITLDSTNNVIKLRINGIVSNELVLTPGTYSSGEGLAEEIQTRINADGKVGSSGTTVEWVDLGETGYLKFSSSQYGSSSKVEMMTAITHSAFTRLGLASGLAVAGTNVAGTINGEEATGSGQILTGKSGNKTTAGLKLKITLTNRDLVGGAEGTISIFRGIASQIDKTLDNITKSTDGSIARRTSALNKQIEDLKEQIADYDERLAARKEDLYKQYQAMEEAMSEYQTIGTYLEQQLASWNDTYNNKNN